jgi:UDP-GlcNAc:undecaprenyl-phosphate/decaprenyl-phosphate GlcNAc-1-phosphate transferase
MSRMLLTALLAGAAGGTFVAALLLTWLARRLALRIGFVDRPGGHKSHREPTPYGGGSAIFLAAWGAFAALLAGTALISDAWVEARFGGAARAYLGGVEKRSLQMLVILIGGFVLHVLGLIDDKRPLPPGRKLLVIVLVTLFVSTIGHVRVVEAAVGPFVSVLLTTAWFVVIVNSLNFLDNMDGLSAGIATICLATLTVCGVLAGQVLVPGLGAVCVGAVAGFLVFNFPPARIFMGDAGSLVVGYLLATLSTLTTYYHSDAGTPPYALAMPFVILAIPLYDFTSVVIIRLLEGRNPMKGDQRHFSHRLVDRGLSRRHAVLTIYLATATTGLAATLLPGASWRQTATICVIVVMVLSIIAILEAPLRKKDLDARN